MQRLIDTTTQAPAGPVPPEEVYRSINFPRGVDVPIRRPYTGVNMVATVDGKVVVGGPHTTELIGSRTDHQLMTRLNQQVDAVLFGAGLVREDDPPYPRLSDDQRVQRAAQGLRPDPLWAVVSGRGAFTHRPRTFDGGPENTALFTPGNIPVVDRHRLEQWTRVVPCGAETFEPVEMGRRLRDDLGVARMMCLGGPTLNATLIQAGLVDELFLTMAPKLHGGAEMPTLMEGAGFDPRSMPVLELLSLYADGGELYLRYRLPRPDGVPRPQQGPDAPLTSGRGL